MYSLETTSAGTPQLLHEVEYVAARELECPSFELMSQCTASYSRNLTRFGAVYDRGHETAAQFSLSGLLLEIMQQPSSAVATSVQLTMDCPMPLVRAQSRGKIMASGGSDTEEALSSEDSKDFSDDDELIFEDVMPENITAVDLCAIEAASGASMEGDSATKKPLSFSEEMSSTVTKQLSRAIFASLLNDYVESEFFVIHGDSLIIQCATNVSLKPGESLHFFFLLEQFLFNLKNKNGRFIIAFFKDFEDLHYPLMRCWRTQVMLHLQENSNVAVHTFSSYHCTEWKAFIKEQAPYFFLVSDKGINREQDMYLKMLILNVLGSMVNVVLTAGQESDNLRVYGYYIGSKPRVRAYVKQEACFSESENPNASPPEGLWLILSTRSQLSGTASNSMNVTNFEETLQQLIRNVQKNQEKRRSLLQHVQQDREKQIQDCIIHLSACFKEKCDIRAVTCAVACAMVLKVHANTQNSQHQDIDLQLTLEDAADLCRMTCLCTALMILLPLSQRAKIRRIKGDWNTNTLMFLRLLEHCQNIVLDTMRECCKKKEINWTCVSDISDYLLLKNIAYYCEKEYNTDLNFEFGKKVEEIYTCLWGSTLKLFSQGEHLNSYELRTTESHFLSSESSVIVEQDKILPVGLLPMRSDIIEDYAGDVIEELPVLSSDHFSMLARKKPYDELIHWHSGRPLSDDYDRTKHENDMKDEWALRNYQKLQTFEYRYGQSLGIKKSKKIVLEHNQPEEKRRVHRGPANKKAPQIKKKDQIIEQNLKKTKAIVETKEQQQWKILALTLKKEIREDLSTAISNLDTFITRLETRTVKFQAQLGALTFCFELWIEHYKTTSEDQRDINIVVEIMKLIQSIFTNSQDMLQGEDKRRVLSYLDQLGFQNLASTIKGSEVLNASEGHKSSYGVGIGSANFQMRYMGPFLQKDERKDPDPRVQHFIPDTWQRELLDVVDNNESAVIVAPTSSGKTYASYYCMEKVLRQSNDSVVVYVAPTKPLVNQVVATVKSQFQKDLPGGRALCGVFTRDYRTDALNCQVLVTVPQCLEILLLCPHRQDWVKQIKYIIFDEVHCLGGEIGAEVWEHLLVMIRCPFLALSATISNPEHLTEWLQSVNKYWQQIKETEDNPLAKQPKKVKNKQMQGEKRSYRVRLVCHDKRYNDLETHICSVQDSEITVQHYHPFAALTLDHMQTYGIPKDLSFSPRESLQLYEKMVQAWPTCANMKALDPEENVHLKNKFISKIDAIKYEDALKRELVEWVKKGHHEKHSEGSRNWDTCYHTPEFTKKWLEAVKLDRWFLPTIVSNQQVLTVLNSLKIHEPNDEMDSLTYFPQLVEKLAQNNKLPALFFADQECKSVKAMVIRCGGCDHKMCCACDCETLVPDDESEEGEISSPDEDDNLSSSSSSLKNRFLFLPGDLPFLLHMINLSMGAERRELQFLDMRTRRVIIPVPRPSQGRGFYFSIFLVKKSSGGFRFILNLKDLNLLVQYRHFKMETIYSVKNILRRGVFMASIDLKDTYWQVPMSPLAQSFMRFAIEDGDRILHFQFVCLPFVLASAPRIFTKVLAEPLAFLRRKGIGVVGYLDDLLLFAQSKDRLLEDIRFAMNLLAHLGWMVNYNKSSLTPSQTMTYLGFEINSVRQVLTLPHQKVLALQEAVRSIYSETIPSVFTDCIILKVDPCYLPKVASDFHRSQEIIPSVKKEDPELMALDVKSLLLQYLNQTKGFRKDDSLFIAFSGPRKGLRVSKTTFDLNIVERMPCILLHHLLEKQKKKQSLDEKELLKLKVKAEKLKKNLLEHSNDLNSKSAKTSSKQEALVIKMASYKSITKKIKKLTETPPDCTYANKKAVDRNTLITLSRGMKYSNYGHLVYFLQRGIGFHHRSVDSKGRRLVEMLFRMGYIKVVTATSTLALGINMPCKSVVFLHDSVFLDALNYRQMAGRAGRRGLDLEGSVYFFNIPMPKVKKLMKSNVPELRGQFPLSISFVLRLMLLAAKADDKEDARAKVLSVLKHSLMSFKQPQQTQVLKLYFVFSLQFLLSEGYLDQDCNPTEFTGLVSHLHYREPSNFVFVIFLEKGLFHQLCKPVSPDLTKFSYSVMETLVLILANLFGRVHCPPSMFASDETFFQSKVFLEKLPDDFAEAVEVYNEKIAKMFGHCILSAFKLADMEKEYRLPLTEISFSGNECLDSELVNHLMSSPEDKNGISPFACLSGNTDHDLMKMTNSSLMLQTVNIPTRHVPILHLEKTDFCGRKMYLNSYALDFFKHGSLSAIVEDNGFNPGDAYYKLRDFYLAIASISVSMKELCEDENDPVVLAFEQLRTIYDQKLKGEFLPNTFS
ncbi:putative ATP-dependent RNA helicase DDX60 [Gastrophryne carolinensis]